MKTTRSSNIEMYLMSFWPEKFRSKEQIFQFLSLIENYQV